MLPFLRIIIVAVSAIVGVGSVVVMKMRHDNPVEEVCETIIEKETGIDLDLTPSSPEVGADKIALDKKDEEEKTQKKI